MTQAKMEKLARIIVSLESASDFSVSFKINNHLVLRAVSEMEIFNRKVITLLLVNEGGYYVNNVTVPRSASEKVLLEALKEIERMVSVEMEVYEYRREIGDYVSGVNEPIC